MNLTFLSYNNYFNRIIKKQDSLTNYITAATAYKSFGGIDFDPKDGVSTSQVINWAETWNPDYLLITDIENNVLSRWFIQEWSRVRGKQYNAVLRRDVVADNYDSLLGATMYVEKATIKNVDDVAIYNKENLELNSIKQNEAILMDSVQVPWLVGYISRTTPQTEVNIKSTDVNAIRINTVTGWDYYQYISTDYKYVTNWNVEMKFSLQPSFIINGGGMATTDGDYNVSTDGPSGYAGRFTGVNTGKDKRLALCSDVTNYLVSQKSNIEAYYTSEHNYQFTNPISALDGKILYAQTTSSGYPAGYYKINVVETDASDTGLYSRLSNDERWFNNLLTSHYSNYAYQSYILQDDPSRNVTRNITYKKYRIELEAITYADLSLTISASARELSDAPYKMFAIPADRCFIKLTNTGDFFYSLSRQEAINAACTIADTLQTNCYDLQLLPYCPFDLTKYNLSAKYIDATKFDSDQKIFISDEQDNLRGIVLFGTTSTFSTRLQFPVVVNNTVIDKKIANQCNNWRLCSPNFSSIFEFNAVKTGNINYFDVDCTYKPFSPYIHINPVWSKLYGRDFNDYRGLICQGDFSVPVLTNNWITYQLNNKNYLNAFNRQIDSIELQNKWATAQDAVRAITGTVQGAAAGAKFGVAGAAIGGAVSAAGGIADIAMGESLRRESLDLTKDQFNFNLQNIQAQPQTLAKVSSFDANNKIFPVLETYSCTNEEKIILKDKMQYNGMTIMRIGNIAEFLDTNEKHYFKGQLIRCEDIKDDTHMLNEIANELYKGVYI